MRNYILVIVHCGVLALLLSGCGNPVSSGDPLEDLNDEYAPIRIAAIKHVGENHMTEAVPRLVCLLLHDDGAVRFYAIQSLREITGKDHGYDYRADEASRAEAVERWYGDAEIFGDATDGENCVPFPAF